MGNVEHIFDNCNHFESADQKGDLTLSSPLNHIICHKIETESALKYDEIAVILSNIIHIECFMLLLHTGESLEFYCASKVLIFFIFY